MNATLPTKPLTYGISAALLITAAVGLAAAVVRLIDELRRGKHQQRKARQ